MQRWHLFLLTVILALMFAAFGPYSRSKAMAARAAELSVAAQDADSAATPEESAARSSVVTANSAAVPNHVPSTCPVTLPQDPPFIPPPPYPLYSPSADHFWYGTDSLWTLLPKKGEWSGTGSQSARI